MKIKNLPRPIRNWLYRYIIFRFGIIYAFSCTDPFTGIREEWAYVGQTRQALISRYNQHMGYDRRQSAQPWSDLDPEIRIVWSGRCTDQMLDWIEKTTIKWRKPVYNYIHNTNNKRRITKYQAAAQRRERDLRRRWDHGRILR